MDPTKTRAKTKQKSTPVSNASCVQNTVAKYADNAVMVMTKDSEQAV